MNDSRVVVLNSGLKGLFRVESSGLLKLLDCFQRDERTKRGGEAPVLQTQKEFYLPNHFSH